MRNNRGQAAMEFLMTYGWAILIVVIAVAALAAFGVFNPDRFAQESCITPGATEFACDGTNIVGNNVLISLTRGSADDVNITGVSASSDGDCGTATLGDILLPDGTSILNQAIDSNQEFVMNVTCSNTLQPDEVFDDIISVEYVLVDNPALGTRSTSVDIVDKP